ncbi:probable aldehyde dehydrogenase [Asparagus officinalis]|uniref:probable aldehyde dehydrogenase n=1 Tax=Asparagus officinalis TaxID=4686 RepID=UPI00098E024E|nr:probable aldehyde dehydrogenase [Asparagus officinalis]
MLRFGSSRGIRAALASFNASAPFASRSIHSPPFPTVAAEEISVSQPAEVLNLVQGKWKASSSWNSIVDPLNGYPFINVAEVQEAEIKPFVESLSSCPKHGLHNPLRSPERYLMFGEISAKAAHMLGQPEVEKFFSRLIQRVSPKSYTQALGEVQVTRKFLENFSGDQVRFLARSFAVPGNHLGQQSNGYRWPYGPVAIITPFNFPLEIPLLQLMGALYMGNKPVLKVDSKVSIVMEQMLRLLHKCGLPKEDVDFINSDGITMNKLLMEAKPQMTLFTGSSRVAEKLAADLKGRVKLEDAGFGWKILGPDVQEVEYVAWVCDQDAYACSGQKCSAQSMLFMHEYGGADLIHDTVNYCSISKNNFALVTKEIFGPFQIVTQYKQDQLNMVLDACERMHAHLTAAVVSNDQLFLQEVLGRSVNGTTYAGMRARTTGAPQNHWFGPAGDPRGAGIGTPEAIKLVVSTMGYGLDTVTILEWSSLTGTSSAFDYNTPHQDIRLFTGVMIEQENASVEFEDDEEEDNLQIKSMTCLIDGDEGDNQLIDPYYSDNEDIVLEDPPADEFHGYGWIDDSIMENILIGPNLNDDTEGDDFTFRKGGLFEICFYKKDNEQEDVGGHHDGNAKCH